METIQNFVIDLSRKFIKLKCVIVFLFRATEKLQISYFLEIWDLW
jgi:hypothetical protein